VYVDDMLVKSVQHTDHLEYLNKTFDLLRQYKVKLNSKKITFGWPPENFWDIWSFNGASRPTPNQISAILNMKSPTCAKEVHILNVHLAALNQFISRSTDKCRPFFQASKKNGADFCWDEECEMAFQGLKRYLTSPPYC